MLNTQYKFFIVIFIEKKINMQVKDISCKSYLTSFWIYFKI